MTGLTFYGGVDEIGGNKILLEDKGTRVFLDFGMQMGKVNEYFTEFMQPRKHSGLTDLMRFDLLPDVGGIYRRDHAKHTGYRDGDHKAETAIDGVLLTHAHVDHCAYIHYLRPEIPIYCSEESRLIMQGFQDMGGGDEYVTYKENYALYENSKGGYSRADGAKDREERPRDIRVIDHSKELKIDSISVESIPIDHSLPGVYGFLIHTSKGDIGLTADIRFHGRRKQDSQKFVDRCGAENLDYLLCEGTRIEKGTTITEYAVEDRAADVVEKTRNLVVCTYPTRDLDRFLSFYNVAKRTGRQLAIDTKQAYLLQLFDESEKTRGQYPGPRDPNLRVFVSRKSWGLLGHPGEWHGQAEKDYVKWERQFLDYPNFADWQDVSSDQRNFIFYCSDFQLTNLYDVRPSPGSKYIRSSTEPFNEEMEHDYEKVKNWLVRFGLLTKSRAWKTLHVSGHGTKDQLVHIIKGTAPKTLVPIHTEHPEMFRKHHKNVKRASLGKRMAVR